MHENWIIIGNQHERRNQEKEMLNSISFAENVHIYGILDQMCDIYHHEYRSISNIQYRQW